MTDLMGYNQIVSWKRGWKRHRIDAEKLDYWEHPWEIEAYGREKCLFEMFKEYWRKEGKNAEEAYKTQSNSSCTPHTIIFTESS